MGKMRGTELWIDEKCGLVWKPIVWNNKRGKYIEMSVEIMWKLLIGARSCSP